MAANWTQTMFNEIRNVPGSYLSKLPAQTLADITNIRAVLNADPNAYNEYVQAMLVRIGRVIMDGPNFANPLSQFKKGLNPMGHMIQNLHFDPIFAEGDFNPAGPNPLGRRTNDNVNVAYHQLNYQPSFVITVDRVGMMNALASWYDLDRFWSEKMRSMYTGATISEYTAMRQVINNAIASTTAGETLPSAYLGQIEAKDEASGKAFVQALKYVINDLKFPNQYNQAGVTDVTQPGELVLLINKDLEPNLDVYTLASLFNEELVKLPTRIVTIDTFNNNATTSTVNQNVLGLLTVPRFFQFYETLNTVRAIENPQGLFNNYFYHPWETIQLNPFATSVVLRSGTAPAA